jgi:uncharacterized protein
MCVFSLPGVSEVERFGAYVEMKPSMLAWATRRRHRTDIAEGIVHVSSQEVRPEKEFEAFLAEGRFMIQRSRSSGRYVFYPRVAEPVTGARDLEWVEASGRGTVYSVTVVRKRPPEADYNVVLIDLEEGPRLMSRVDGVGVDSVRIGLNVQAKIVVQDGAPLLVFTRAQPS